MDPEFAFCFINLLFEIGAVGVLLAIGFARQSGFPAELEATCSRISDRPTAAISFEGAALLLGLARKRLRRSTIGDSGRGP